MQYRPNEDSAPLTQPSSTRHQQRRPGWSHQPTPSLTEGPGILPDGYRSLHRAATGILSAWYLQWRHRARQQNLARLSHSQKTTSKSIPCLYLLKRENMILASTLHNPISVGVVFCSPCPHLLCLGLHGCQWSLCLGTGHNIFMLV